MCLTTIQKFTPIELCTKKSNFNTRVELIYLQNLSPSLLFFISSYMHKDSSFLLSNLKMVEFPLRWVALYPPLDWVVCPPLYLWVALSSSLSLSGSDFLFVFEWLYPPLWLEWISLGDLSPPFGCSISLSLFFCSFPFLFKVSFSLPNYLCNYFELLHFSFLLVLDCKDFQNYFIIELQIH